MGMAYRSMIEKRNAHNILAGKRDKERHTFHDHGGLRDTLGDDVPYRV
jgi:hypothetical protein